MHSAFMLNISEPVKGNFKGNIRGKQMAGREGVEPSLGAPKAPVLPLDDLPAAGSGRPAAKGPRRKPVAPLNLIGRPPCRQVYAARAHTPRGRTPRSCPGFRC